MRPLAVAFIESVIDAFVDAARSLGLHAIVERHDPEVPVDEPALAIEATSAHVEEEENAA